MRSRRRALRNGAFGRGQFTGFGCATIDIIEQARIKRRAAERTRLGRARRRASRTRRPVRTLGIESQTTCAVSRAFRFNRRIIVGKCVITRHAIRRSGARLRTLVGMNFFTQTMMAPARRHVETSRANILTSSLDLVLILLRQIGIDEIRGIEAQIPRICVDHIARIAARGHVGQVPRLNRLQNIGANAQLAGDGHQIFARTLARLTQNIAEIRFVHSYS